MSGKYKLLQPAKSIVDLENSFYDDDHKKKKSAAISKAMATSMALKSIKK